MIEDGTIVNIESSGVRGKIGDAISHGKLKGLATMRSHGGRVRAIETGETHVDIAFIGAPSCDEYGNCSGMGGKTNCGVLSYAYVDAEMADYVVAVTDCLVDYPNYPAEINQTKVDYVCVVDQIGIPEKIATGAAQAHHRPAQDPDGRVLHSGRCQTPRTSRTASLIRPVSAAHPSPPPSL